MNTFDTLLIASPSPLVRAGLKSLVQDATDWYLLGEAGTAGDLLSRLRDLQVDALLADLDIAEDGAGELVARLRAVSPSTKIVALADAWNDTRIVPALGAGAHAFIVRRSSAGEIADALRAARAGSLVLNPAATELLKLQLQPREPVEALSARELEVLRALARGLPNKLIAQELIISEHTVKFHIRSILDKLDASNRTDAVRIGIERGLVAL
ncbi:MAG: response regulator transcription factor [Chloroflexi bacterium]|nr:response regulator transcription factor [Chloroflexota bacterium]